eukprot:3818354-Rhodomonas_salina.1
MQSLRNNLTQHENAPMLAYTTAAAVVGNNSEHNAKHWQKKHIVLASTLTDGGEWRTLLEQRRVDTMTVFLANSLFLMFMLNNLHQTQSAK